MKIQRFGLAEDGPVVFTCKSKYAALIVNLGSFSRGRKQTVPSAYASHLESGYSQPSKGALVKSLAQSKSHLFIACEASEVNQEELKFLPDRGWSVLRNRSGDIVVGCRTNFVGENMKRLAGSTLVGVAHNALPLTYMIVGSSMAILSQSADKGTEMTFRWPRLQTPSRGQDLFGGRPYKDCDHPDWSTFPGLDPMVATVFEWGHSMDDEQWSMMPSNMPEFKVSVSEWLLNSTSAAYLNDRDYDSHTPLLIEAVVPLSLMLSATMLRKNYSTVQLMGSAAVVAGVLIGFLPSLFTSDRLGQIRLVWVAVFLVSRLPQAAANVVAEGFLEGHRDFSWAASELFLPEPMSGCDKIRATLMPWIAFVLSLSLFVCLYHDHAAIVWMLELCCMVLCVLSISLGRFARNATLMAIGFLCLASIGLGAAVGTWLEAWMRFNCNRSTARSRVFGEAFRECHGAFWQLYRSSSYQIVNPHDASREVDMVSFLKFVDGTVVDEKHSLGHLAKLGSRGSIYCVAPVVLEHPAAKQARSNFSCGTFLQGIMDDVFGRAVLQASSVFGIKAAATPRLVALLEHPSQLLAQLWYEAWPKNLLTLVRTAQSPPGADATYKGDLWAEVLCQNRQCIQSRKQSSSTSPCNFLAALTVSAAWKGDVAIVLEDYSGGLGCLFGGDSSCAGAWHSVLLFAFPGMLYTLTEFQVLQAASATAYFLLAALQLPLQDLALSVLDDTMAAFRFSMLPAIGLVAAGLVLYGRGSNVSAGLERNTVISWMLTASLENACGSTQMEAWEHDPWP
eukprot:s2704_g6.t3